MACLCSPRSVSLLDAQYTCDQLRCVCCRYVKNEIKPHGRRISGYFVFFSQNAERLETPDCNSIQGELMGDVCVDLH